MHWHHLKLHPFHFFFLLFPLLTKMHYAVISDVEGDTLVGGANSEALCGAICKVCTSMRADLRIMQCVRYPCLPHVVCRRAPREKLMRVLRSAKPEAEPRVVTTNDFDDVIHGYGVLRSYGEHVAFLAVLTDGGIGHAGISRTIALPLELFDTGPVTEVKHDAASPSSNSLVGDHTGITPQDYLIAATGEGSAEQQPVPAWPDAVVCCAAQLRTDPPSVARKTIVAWLFADHASYVGAKETKDWGHVVGTTIGARCGTVLDSGLITEAEAADVRALQRYLVSAKGRRDLAAAIGARLKRERGPATRKDTSVEDFCRTCIEVPATTTYNCGPGQFRTAAVLYDHYTRFCAGSEVDPVKLLPFTRRIARAITMAGGTKKRRGKSRGYAVDLEQYDSDHSQG
jgi:hypothetical protein